MAVLSMLLASVLAPDANAGTAPAVRLVYQCEQGRSFSVEPKDMRARVWTIAGQFELDRRRSSIGIRYDSAIATLILDEDRAALNGLPGGPFRRCTLANGRHDARVRRS